MTRDDALDVCEVLNRSFNYRGGLDRPITLEIADVLSALREYLPTFEWALTDEESRRDLGVPVNSFYVKREKAKDGPIERSSSPMQGEDVLARARMLMPTAEEAGQALSDFVEIARKYREGSRG